MGSKTMALLLLLAACGPLDVAGPDASTSAPDSGGVAFDSGVAVDAGLTDSGAMDAGPPPTVRVLTDLQLPGHPHDIDAFIPTNAERVIVFLHGGGGTKETGASRESGIRLDDPARSAPVLDEAFLIATRTGWVFPQGQHLPGARLAKTWSNYMMISGVDDVAFLGALAAALRSGSLQATVPAFSRVYLAGHSNGGVMANRQWCESTTSFEAYGSVSGPPSTDLLSTGAHPCMPSAQRPFIGIIGALDTVLQTANNWSGAWSVNSCLQMGAGAAMPNPNVANEETYHRMFRVPRICSGTPSPPTSNAQSTTWSDCDGRAKLIRVEGADHCVAVTTNDACVGGTRGGGCPNSLDGQLGVRMRQVLTDFFVSTER